MNKLLIITGPTATGKTSLGIKIAKKFNGEIISADSRQVYKFMDIGTGKDKEEYLNNNVKIWGIDLVDPDYNFNVSDYLNYASVQIRFIQKREKLPIIVGGTALYIKALLEPFETINIPPDEGLRNKFSSYSVNDLQKELQKLDINKWEKMNDSDRKNPRRLIRAIEIVTFLSFPRRRESNKQNSKVKRPPANWIPGQARNDIFIISFTATYDFLYTSIDKRVDDRMEQGAVQEVQNLLKMGYTFDLPSLSASGYKEFKEYFLSAIHYPFTLSEVEGLSACVQNWKLNEHAYARRQVSFINKFLKEQTNKNIKNIKIDIETPNWQSEVTATVGQWYSNITNDSKEN